MTFGIDYDGTWSEDPELFRAFSKMASERGHKVLIVTMRCGAVGDALDYESHHAHATVFCGEKGLKAEVCKNVGHRVDVWIDDMPEMIGGPAYLLGQSKEQQKP
jgi:hypothetical protein